MAELSHAHCEHQVPCSCVDYRNRTFEGLESIIDFLEKEVEMLALASELASDLEQERDDLLDYVKVLETQLNIRGSDA